MKTLQTKLKEIQYWSKFYEFNFQFWPDQNNVYVNKSGIEIFVSGGNETMEEVIDDALGFVKKINRR